MSAGYKNNQEQTATRPLVPSLMEEHKLQEIQCGDRQAPGFDTPLPYHSLVKIEAALPARVNRQALLYLVRTPLSTGASGPLALLARF